MTRSISLFPISVEAGNYSCRTSRNRKCVVKCRDLDDEYRLQYCFPPGWDDEFLRDFQARKADELGLSKDSFRVNERASRNKKRKHRKHDHSPHHETRSADEAFNKASRNKRTKCKMLMSHMQDETYMQYAHELPIEAYMQDAHESWL
ncbi:hypothetical protein Droror1_Dr00018068 [Drosera rotundifolia]